MFKCASSHDPLYKNLICSVLIFVNLLEFPLRSQSQQHLKCKQKYSSEVHSKTYKVFKDKEETWPLLFEISRKYMIVATLSEIRDYLKISITRGTQAGRSINERDRKIVMKK